MFGLDVAETVAVLGLVVTLATILAGAVGAFIAVKSRNETTRDAVKTLGTDLQTLEISLCEKIAAQGAKIDAQMEERRIEEKKVLENIIQMRTKLMGMGGNNGLIGELCALQEIVERQGKNLERIAAHLDIELNGK